MNSINLNEDVWVRLTYAGQDVLVKYLLTRGKNVPRGVSYSPLDELEKFDAGGGWRVFKLSDLMAIFGQAMGTAGKSPFEDNVIRLTRP